MEWRFYGPLLLAVVMFLLVGTVIERRIELAIRRIMEQRQAMLRMEAEQAADESTLQTATTMTSHRSLCKARSDPIINQDKTTAHVKQNLMQKSLEI